MRTNDSVVLRETVRIVHIIDIKKTSPQRSEFGCCGYVGCERPSKYRVRVRTESGPRDGDAFDVFLCARHTNKPSLSV